MMAVFIAKVVRFKGDDDACRVLSTRWAHSRDQQVLAMLSPSVGWSVSGEGANQEMTKRVQAGSTGRVCRL